MNRKYSTESDEELNSSIAEIESKSFEDFDISSNVEESEEYESDLSYYTSTINVTDVLSDNSFDIGNCSSIAEIGFDEIDDIDIEVLESDLVDDEFTVKDTSSSLPVDKTDQKLCQDHSCCLINELDNNKKKFVSTWNTVNLLNTYAEPINEKSILEKIDCMSNVLHEFNNRVKIIKVESFNNNCKNENKIVYKIKKLKSKKEDLRLSNHKTTIDDLILNIQALNQQTSTYIFQLKETISKYETKNRRLEERLEVLENLMLKRYNLDQQVETEIKDTLLSTTQNNVDVIEKNLKEVDDETINYNEHHKITNIASWTKNVESTVEGNLMMFEDEELIYQHKESSNVIIGWHKDEKNTIENNLLLVENGDIFHDYEQESITDSTDVSCSQNLENICGKNLPRIEDKVNFYERKELFNTSLDWSKHEENIIEDNSMIMKDNESIYKFEEWLDSPFSDLENEENPENNFLSTENENQIEDQINFISAPNESNLPTNSLENVEDLLIDKSTRNHKQNFIPYFSPTNEVTLNFQPTSDNNNEFKQTKFTRDFKPSNTEKIILTEKPVLKRKELSVILDRDAVPNYLKKKKMKSFDSVFASCSNSEKIISLVKREKRTQLLKMKKNKDNKKEKNIKLEVEFPEYNCTLCKSKFINFKLFYEHVESHTKTECNCKQSNINYNKPNLLGEHENKKKPFKYNASNHSRTSNRRIRSSDQRPFKCKFCSFTCAYASNLHVHKLRHVFEKSNKCTICQ